MKNRSWYMGYLVNFLAMACHMASTLLSVHWKQAGFEDGQIGSLAATFSMAAIASRLGLGYGLERWGRKPFLILGAALLTLLVGVYPYLGNNFSYWLLVRLLQGVGLGCYITAILTWVADRSPPDKIGQLQGVFGVSGLVGSAFGPWAAERVYLQAGFPTMFDVLIAGGIVCCLLVCLLPETRKKSSLAQRELDGKFAISAHLAVLVVSLPFGWFVGTLMTFIAPFLDSIDLPKVGVYFASFGMASVGVRIFGSRLLDQLEPARLVLMSGTLLSLSALSIASLSFYPSLKIIVLAALLNGVGHGFLFPGLSALTVRQSSDSQRGSALAFFTGSFDVGILAGALVSGYLSQWLDYSATFALSSGLLLLSLPAFVGLNKKRPKAPLAP